MTDIQRPFLKPYEINLHYIYNQMFFQDEDIFTTFIVCLKRHSAKFKCFKIYNLRYVNIEDDSLTDLTSLPLYSWHLSIFYINIYNIRTFLNTFH